MLFSDIYMQILEQNENEKQRVNGNVAIYMYKRKTTGKFLAFRLDSGVPLENTHPLMDCAVVM